MVAVILLLGAIGGLASGSEPASAIEVASASDRDEALVAWAKSRFADAGLKLPSIAVAFDPSGELCDEADGLYRGDGLTNEVAICIGEGDTAGLNFMRRRTLLHEFAHAWDRANLDHESRRRLMTELRTEVWVDKQTRWKDRGAERFAETVVHALLDQQRRPVMVPLDCPDLAAIFELATGARALGPGLPWCVAQPAS